MKKQVRNTIICGIIFMAMAFSLSISVGAACPSATLMGNEKFFRNSCYSVNCNTYKCYIINCNTCACNCCNDCAGYSADCGTDGCATGLCVQGARISAATATR
ncbi:MAG: hypothetical protein LBR74_05775 [Eubacterium sp.]|jgi:hypothetical protein|nr:hypothetical protein [Eubacterium sp.]